MTDEAGQYHRLGDDLASHESVNHGAREYGRGDVHTNTVEGFFYSVFKRGMKGITSTAARSTYIATWRSSISATTIAFVSG